MKHTILILTATVSLSACNSGDGRRALSAHIEGAAGKTLYFDRFQDGKPVHVDSVTLDGNGAGTLHIPRMPMDFYRITLDGTDQTILALDSTDEVAVEARAGAMMVPDKVSGSKASEELHAFYKESQRLDAERDSLRGLLNAGGADPAVMERYNQVNTRNTELCKKFIADHPGSPALLSAVSKLNMQQDMSLFVKVRDDLKRTMPQSGFYRAFRDQVDRAEKMDVARKAQQEQMQRMSNLVPVGAEAPEIRQPTPQGRELALSDLRGKVVLVDFWASWCKPCRMENPNVVAAYNKYKSKGFDILGVSLDRDKTAWENAIKQDGLTWNHVSDLQFWSNAAAQTYGVNSIPFSVLVDKDGKVLDKNLRGPALEQRLAQLLGS